MKKVELLLKYDELTPTVVEKLKRQKKFYELKLETINRLLEKPVMAKREVKNGKSI